MKDKIVLISIVATLLTSCSSHTPTQGDKMMTVSNHAKALSDQWNKGEQLSMNGDAMQKKGQLRANDGEGMVSKGQNMISDGNDMANAGKEQSAHGRQLKQQSENNFSEQYSEKTAS